MLELNQEISMHAVQIRAFLSLLCVFNDSEVRAILG